MNIKTRLITLLFCLGIGCAVLLGAYSAPNPSIIANATQSLPTGTALEVVSTTEVGKIRDGSSNGVLNSELPEQSDKIFITEHSLPSGMEFEVLSKIEVGGGWYGSHESILPGMADKARELGANAVVQVVKWNQPSWWAWAAPYASGQAVRIPDMKDLEAFGISGNWY